MGLNPFQRRREPEVTRTTDLDAVSQRYNQYFPRLFAYVRSCVGGDLPAQDIVVEAFKAAFRHPRGADEETFRSILFRAARPPCRAALRRAPANGDALNSREREMLSLIFDAGLTRKQIARVFHIREATVSSVLMTGLRKLKQQTSPAAAAAYLKLA